MKTQLVALCLFSIACTLCHGQTQDETNAEAGRDLKKVEDTLTRMVIRIHDLYKSDKVFLSAFDQCQAQWLKFRDAELRMKFPEQSSGYYGSVLPMCEAYFLSDLTNARIKELQPWIDGAEEGDVCSGSLRFKE